MISTSDRRNTAQRYADARRVAKSCGDVGISVGTIVYLLYIVYSLTYPPIQHYTVGAHLKGLCGTVLTSRNTGMDLCVNQSLPDAITISSNAANYEPAMLMSVIFIAIMLTCGIWHNAHVMITESADLVDQALLDLQTMIEKHRDTNTSGSTFMYTTDPLFEPACYTTELCERLGLDIGIIHSRRALNEYHVTWATLEHSRSVHD